LELCLGNCESNDYDGDEYIFPKTGRLRDTHSEGKVMLLLNLERETGIEPATNGLGSRYSTIELLPLQTELYLAE